MSVNLPPDVAALKSEAWKKTYESFGTAYIFEVRARRLRRNLNRLTFVGLGVPLVVGLIVLGYGTEAKALKWLLPVAIAMGAIQVVVFAWSVVAGWVDRYQRAVHALVANRSLNQRYESLAREFPQDITDYRHRTEVVDAADSAQRDDDSRQEISDAEKHMGLRACLRQYERSCTSCNKRPTDMNPTECGVCGDYPKRWVD